MQGFRDRRESIPGGSGKNVPVFDGPGSPAFKPSPPSVPRDGPLATLVPPPQGRAASSPFGRAIAVLAAILMTAACRPAEAQPAATKVIEFSAEKDISALAFCPDGQCLAAKAKFTGRLPVQPCALQLHGLRRYGR
jgi:hypothetical protein